MSINECIVRSQSVLLNHSVCISFNFKVGFWVSVFPSVRSSIRGTLRRVRRHFVMLIQSNMHVIQYNPGHKLSATLCGGGGVVFLSLSFVFV